jgi:flagellar basal body rod protein FlgG
MIKGLYSAASAMLAGVHRHKILSHNAANVETPGFKQVLTSLTDFMETSVNFPPGGRATSTTGQTYYVGDLGLGVEDSPDTTDYSEAGFQNTGHHLDFAINGPGYFRVMTPNGERLTRDGRFQKDAQGGLVTVEGHQVLDPNGRPIKLPDGDLTVNPDGSILVNNQAAGRLGLAAFKNPETDLARDENNTFRAVGTPSTQVAVSVHQGFLEGSNVNPSELMTQMVTVARSYEAAQKMVTTQDELLGKSISMLGRLA